LLNELVHKEKKSLTQRSLELAQKRNAREDEIEREKDNAFIPTNV
jgi:hypothetical protein